MVSTCATKQNRHSSVPLGIYEWCKGMRLRMVFPYSATRMEFSTVTLNKG